MQHESSNNEFVAGRRWKFHANSVGVKPATSTAAAAISNARLTAQYFSCIKDGVYCTLVVSVGRSLKRWRIGDVSVSLCYLPSSRETHKVDALDQWCLRKLLVVCVINSTYSHNIFHIRL